MKSKTIALLAIALIFSSLNIFAQEFPLTENLPKDEAVITGKLKNGITYYIRHNELPENRIEFRLAINAGSVLEDDDQQGLAHFLEHMCFNGTEDFSKNELVNYLEKSGVDFGADLNAYTSFDETVYMFQMPSDRIGLIDSGFMVLENWAHKVSLENEEIDKERGVIKEEWRLGLGAQERMMKEYIPILFSGSKYANRLPIGKIDIIDSFDYDVLKRFYRDWYRPDLMAVIIVGDIEPAYAEEQIKKHFSKIKGPKKKDLREREEFIIPDNEEPLVAITTDPEATMNMASVMFKHPKKHIVTNADYRDKLISDLYVKMLNARLYEITQKPEAPVLYGGVNYGGFIGRSIDTYSMYAIPKPNMIDDAVKLLVEENERVKEFGFTTDELKRKKAELLSDIEKAQQEKDKTESRRLVQEYLNNFLESEPFPGIDYELALTQAYLPQIKLEEINKLADKLITDKNMIVLITGPEKEDVIIPTKEEILEVIETAKAASLTAYAEDKLAESLIDEDIVAGKIVDIKENKEFGFYELKLSNGIEVTLKPTDFKNDEILMTCYAPGGQSLAEDNNIINADFASQIMSMSGVGNFDEISLNKFMTGKNVSVSPSIGKLSQGFTGNSVNKDLETMFQLTWLNFTSPRKDTTALKTFKSQMITQFKFMMANPQMAFYKKFREMSTSNNPRVIIIPTEDQLNSIDIDKVYDFYTSLYKNAGDFKFFFVGSFDMETIKPLIEKYIASLPSTNETTNWVDRNIEFPKGVNEADVYKGTEPKSMVGIMIKDDFDYTMRNSLELQMAVKILSIRLRETMREDQGGVYGVQVQQNSSKYEKPSYNVFVAWGCSPDNVDTLVNTVFTEMGKLRDKLCDDVNLEKAIETYIRDLESNQEKNKYWLGKLKSAQWEETKLYTVDELHDLVKSITKEDIQKAANKYFKEDHYIKVVLRPEEKE
ncbi:MAG: insulinase family protein [Marinilabiliales bacterium]|nr:MAG: insulinase family protein [Marinilabiliales bacterium]